ncbi:MAG: DUF2924 domain-containing protein [Phycisphaerales bacterium]|nr:DUF2924 domain-containing protein [Phycisphaerales bacterium]
MNVRAEVTVLQGKTTGELKARYGEVFGELTRSNNKVYLIKRIVWRMQAIEQGGLTERALRRAEELANDADLRVRVPKTMNAEIAAVLVAPLRAASPTVSPAGTVLTREYKGRTVAVRVLPKGFEYEGRVFRSLSAIANHVTGSHWNGAVFFGLRGDKGEDGQRKRSRGKEAAA